MVHQYYFIEIRNSLAVIVGENDSCLGLFSEVEVSITVIIIFRRVSDKLYIIVLRKIIDASNSFALIKCFYSVMKL